MADEIFDYFGGHSAREFEPFEDDEITSQLDEQSQAPLAETADEEPQLSSEEPASPAEELPVAGSDDSATPVQEALDEPAVLAESADASEASEEADPQSSGSDPWAALASDLGLQVPETASKTAESVTAISTAKPKAPAARKPRSRKTSTVPATETASEPVGKTDPVTATGEPSTSEIGSASGIPAKDTFGFGILDEDPAEESVLTDMFTPRDETQFETPAEPEATTIEDDLEDEAGDSPTAEDGLEFIEFDVEELDSSRSSDSVPRPRRQRRSGNDPQRGERPRKRGRTDRNADSAEPPSDKPKARGRRDRSQSRDSEPVSNEDSPTSSESSRRTEAPNRRRGKETVESDGKKKRKIPTWSETVTVIVENNLSSRTKAKPRKRIRRKRK